MQPTSSSYESAKCSGRASVRLEHLRHERQRDGDEALHVADAATDEAIADLRRLPRIGRPWLAVDGHDIGVAGQHDAAVDRGPIVAKRFAFFRVSSNVRRDAMP